MSEYINRFMRETECYESATLRLISSFFFLPLLYRLISLSGSKQSPPGIFKFSSKTTEERKLFVDWASRLFEFEMLINKEKQKGFSKDLALKN